MKNKVIILRVSEEDLLKIDELCKKTNLSRSELLRKLGTSQQLKDRSYNILMDRCFKLHGEVNKVGGLLKKHLADYPRSIIKLPVREALHKLEKVSLEIKEFLKTKL